MKHAFDFVENLESNFCRAFKMTFRYIGICTSEQAHAVYVHTPHTNICTCAIHANFGKWTQVEQSTKWYWTRHFLDDLIDTKPKTTTDWREFEKKNVLWLPRMVAHAGVTISSLCWLFLFYYIFSDYFFSLLCCLTMVCYIHLCIMSVVAAVVAIVAVVVTKYSRCSTQTDRLIPTHIHTVCNTDALVSRNSHKTFIQCFFLFYIRIVRKTKMKKRIFYIWYYTNVYNNIESICDVLSLSLARFIYLLFSVIMSDSTQNVFSSSYTYVCQI